MNPARLSSPKRFKRWLPLALFGAVCASAAAWGLATERNPAAPGSPPHAPARAAAPPPVTVAQARNADVPIELRAFGSVEASSTVDVVPQVSGLITEVHFSEGSSVEKGDLLFSVDTRPYRASQAAARAELAKSLALAQQADSEARRFAELEQQGVASAQQRAQADADAAGARAQVQQLRAQLDSASLNVSFTRITAPIAGKTGSLLVHPGNVIQANAPQPLVVIRSLSPVQVRFAVPEAYLPQIRDSLSGRALPVRATPRGDAAQTAQGQLTFMENSVDTTTGTIGLKATFANRDQSLWPGASVEVVLTLGVDQQALVVPAEAVRDAQNGSYVFVIGPDRIATQRPVEVLRTTPELALIREGVRAGEQVVTDGYVRLRNGTQVAIQQPAPGAAAEHARADLPDGAGP